MIVGNGMMAKAFKNYEDRNEILIFASGVSNSKETDESNFKREEDLLNNTLKNNSKSVVYFSTCSVYDPFLEKSDYVQHKLKMEKIIENKCNKFFIFRLPQVVGKTNSPTLINFLFTSILNDKKIDINKHSTRNLISINDVFSISNYLIENNIYANEITNVATPYNIPVLDIVLMVEKIARLNLNYKLIDQGSPFTINIDKLNKLKINLNIFDPNYLNNTLDFFFKGFIKNNKL